MTRFPLILAFVCFALPGFAAPPLTVEILTVEKRMETREFSLTGEIVARDPVEVSFPTGGRLADVPIEAGDRVAAGAVLARLDAVQQEQALRAAQAALASAQADYNQAKDDFDRQESLLERGATTRLARDNAEDAFSIAEGNLAQAEAQFDLARKSLDDTVLKAPKDATVIEKLGEPGEVVGAAQSVVRLALGAEFDAVFDVPEALLIDAKDQRRVRLTLLDYPDAVFAGEGREVSPLVDTARGTVAVTVSVIDPPEVASFGDAVIGTVSWKSLSQIALPHSVLASTRAGPAVWVVDPETMAVSLHPIEVARFETGRIILAGGLEPGALVVGRGAHLLFPGRVVRPAEDVQ